MDPTPSPTDRLEIATDHLLDSHLSSGDENRALVEHVETEIATGYETLLSVPDQAAEEALEVLARDLAETAPSEFDQHTARKFVVACTFANSLRDEWNPSYRANL